MRNNDQTIKIRNSKAFNNKVRPFSVTLTQRLHVCLPFHVVISSFMRKPHKKIKHKYQVQYELRTFLLYVHYLRFMYGYLPYVFSPLWVSFYIKTKHVLRIRGYLLINMYDIYTPCMPGVWYVYFTIIVATPVFRKWLNTFPTRTGMAFFQTPKNTKEKYYTYI